MNARPTAIGIVDWKTIAPVMLPSARLSLPSLTQKKLFAFSGSSVASGASTSESTSGSIPIVLGDVDQLLDEQVRAADDRAEADERAGARSAPPGGSSPGVRSMYSGPIVSASWTSPPPRSVWRT